MRLASCLLALLCALPARGKTITIDLRRPLPRELARVRKTVRVGDVLAVHLPTSEMGPGFYFVEAGADDLPRVVRVDSRQATPPRSAKGRILDLMERLEPGSDGATRCACSRRGDRTSTSGVPRASSTRASAGRARSTG